MNLLFGFLLLALSFNSAQAGTISKKAETSMTPIKIEDVQRLIKEKSAPLALSYWRHGGEPGTLSRQYLISLKKEKFTGLYREDGRSFETKPSKEFTHVYEIELTDEETLNIFKKVLMSPVFELQPKGHTPQVADVMIDDWEITLGPKVVQATFREPIPANQKEIQSFCFSLMEKIKAKSRK